MTHNTRTAIGWCEACEKLLYPSRKAAREGAKGHGEHKGAYRCEYHTVFEFWHIGGLPSDIRRGHVTRDQFYRRTS